MYRPVSNWNLLLMLEVGTLLIVCSSAGYKLQNSLHVGEDIESASLPLFYFKMIVIIFKDIDNSWQIWSANRSIIVAKSNLQCLLIYILPQSGNITLPFRHRLNWILHLKTIFWFDRYPTLVPAFDHLLFANIQYIFSWYVILSSSNPIETWNGSHGRHIVTLFWPAKCVTFIQTYNNCSSS
jgi:hypothetical protein